MVAELEKFPVLYHPTTFLPQTAHQFKDADNAMSQFDFLDTRVYSTKSTSSSNTIAEKKCIV
jgi:hypothetical protein